MIKTSVREKLSAAFMAALQEEQLPWHACWSNQRPQNAVTGRAYRGINNLYLSLIAEERGYTDPRWCTFNQANDKGWRVKKGEHSTPVEYWAKYDPAQKKLLSWSEAEQLLRDDPEAAQRLELRCYFARVFNAAQIKGIPPMTQQHTTDIGDLRSQRDTLLHNMSLSYREQGDRAYYSPLTDTVTLPPEGSFEDPYGYMCTILHECGHATGHPSRLNRPLAGDYGSPDYAREELRAEIASAFTAQELGIDMPEAALKKHTDLHKAYIQAWVSILQEQPDELFAAIKDANSIADYLIEKGEFEKLRDRATVSKERKSELRENWENETNDPDAEEWRENLTPQERKLVDAWDDGAEAGMAKMAAKTLELEAQRKRQVIPQHQDISEMKHFPKELVALAKAQDVLDIIRKTGEPLFEKERQIRSVEHDSLVITPGKGFYWFSHGVGSQSPIDYFMWVKKLSFVEATRKVLMAMDVVHAPEQLQSPVARKEKAQRPFYVPAAAKDQGIAFSYLTEDRKLDKALVTELMQQGLILQAEKYNSVVFLGKDYNGQVSSGFVRYSPSAPPKNGVWRMDLAGSQKDYRFRIEHPESRSVYVFESEIDLLSYLTMLPKEQRTENYISLGGVSPRALQCYLKHRPETQEIHICTDTDEAGEAAANNIAEVLEEKYRITRERSVHKDWNEDLMHGFTADHEREKQHSPALLQSDALSMASAMAKLNPIPAQQQVKLDLPRAHMEQWDY